MKRRLLKLMAISNQTTEDISSAAITLLLSISRPLKEKGFVVDYVDIGHHLKRVIDNYDEREQQEIEDTLSFPEEEIRQLEADYRAIMELLAYYGLTDLTDLILSIMSSMTKI